MASPLLSRPEDRAAAPSPALRFGGAVVWAVALLALPLVPTRDLATSPRVAALADLCHVPIAAGLTLLLWRLLRRQESLALGLALALLAGVEGAQALLGTGQPSFGDFGLDLVGVGVAWVALRHAAFAASTRHATTADRVDADARGAPETPVTRRLLRGRAIALIALLLAGPAAVTARVFVLESARMRAFPLLAGFEAPHELRAWDADGGAELSLTSRHATEGRSALALLLGEGERPALRLVDPPRDWRGYARLTADVYVAGDEPLALTLKLSDRVAWRDPTERLRRDIVLDPGHGRLDVSLEDALVAGGHRRLDLTQMKSLVLFSTGLSEPRLIEIDNLRLVPPKTEGQP